MRSKTRRRIGSLTEYRMTRKTIALFYYVVVEDNAIGRCNRIVLERLCDKYDFTVFAVKFDNPRPDRIRWVRIGGFQRPMFLYYFVFRIAAWLAYLSRIVANRRQFDLVVASDGCIDFAPLAHVHFCNRFYCRHLLRFRDLLSMRGLTSALDHFARAMWEGRLYRRTQHVVVPSAGLRQELMDVYGAKADNVAVIANPVDLEKYSPRPEERERLRKELGLTPTDFACVFVALGHFERKGLGELVDALANSRMSGVKLLVVGGSANATAPYRKRAQDLRIEENIIFCGHHADTRPFLWAADAFVLPSRYETFSVVATEAAACGLPVVTTTLSGVRDWARSGVTGFGLADSSAPSIVDSIGRLVEMGPDERQRLGDNARNAVLRYGIEKYVEAFELTYTQALANGKTWSATPGLDDSKTLNN
jgi:glycosyltransferase involved in cell wall biosynthesis